MTEQQRQVQRWLSRGLWQMEEIDQLREERREILTRLTKITQSMTGETVSASKDPHKYDILVSLDLDIDNKIKALDKTLCEIREAITGLSDSRYRTAMTWHYCNGFKWEDVADKMGYEVRQVYRFNRLSLKELEGIKKETVD